MSRHNQLLSGVQVRNIPLSSGVQGTGLQINSKELFGGITFLVNFSTAGAYTIKLQDCDTLGGTYTDTKVGYQVKAIGGNPLTAAPGTTNVVTSTSVLSVDGTIASAGQYLALSLSHPGKDSDVQTSNTTAFVARPFFKVVVSSGTAANAVYAVALLYNASLTPVSQDAIVAESKGTN